MWPRLGGEERSGDEGEDGGKPGWKDGVGREGKKSRRGTRLRKERVGGGGVSEEGNEVKKGVENRVEGRRSRKGKKSGRGRGG